jgi:mono/diheme cytochrome c family protein
MRRLRNWLALALVILMGLAGAVIWLNLRGEAAISEARPGLSSAGQIERGRYLALAGNCAACHTRQGATAYSGGRPIDTPFGTIFSSNLTPDAKTGLGQWSADQFWRALHHGRSRDGRLLYPAFPYLNYTLVTREDSDALLAYFLTLPPVEQAQKPSTLGWPYNTQWALAVWRALYFKADAWRPEPTQSDQWNRGAYLVQGLGHCGACHTPRDELGGPQSSDSLSGSLLPGQRWYAPALTSVHEAGVSSWPTEDVVQLLRDGVNAHAVVSGPMAEVVYRSTQYLSETDLTAMAIYLRSLPEHAPAPVDGLVALPAQINLGKRVYGDHCAQCHGQEGQGVPGAWPALAGNRAVTMGQPANLVRIVLGGGFAPTTAGNPRPHGMPPFRHQLGDEEIAAVISYIRAAWGNNAGPISTLDLLRDRKGE